MLNRLDAWLLAGPYQWLIDVSGKKREWWVEQCAYAYLVAGMLDAFLTVGSDGKRWLLAGLTMVVALLIFLDAKIPAMMEMTAAMPHLRRLFLVVSCFSIPLRLLEMSPRGAAAAIATLALLSSYYFAACRPPKPREPRRKMVMAGGGA